MHMMILWNPSVVGHDTEGISAQQDLLSQLTGHTAASFSPRMVTALCWDLRQLWQAQHTGMSEGFFFWHVVRNVSFCKMLLCLQLMTLINSPLSPTWKRQAQYISSCFCVYCCEPELPLCSLKPGAWCGGHQVSQACKACLASVNNIGK